MPDHNFLFALVLSDEPHFDRMVQDLAAVVLRYVGYDPAAVATVMEEVRTALGAGVTHGDVRCDVQFRAADGALHVSIAFAGGSTWETARALPAGS